MYVPRHFEPDPAVVDAMLRNPGAADLVSPTAAGLVATTLPLWFNPDVGPMGALLGHVARGNDHWRAEPTGESLSRTRWSAPGLATDPAADPRPGGTTLRPGVPTQLPFYRAA